VSIRLRKVIGLVVVLFVAYLCVMTWAGPHFAHDNGHGTGGAVTRVN
jgi:hypothetical protein